MGHIQTQEEWEVQMAEKILSYVRNELYLELRYLDVAFSALVPQADASLQSFATDGGHLFYSTEQILRVFEKNAPYLNRAYLHTVLHCIFSHPWIAGNRDRKKMYETDLKLDAPEAVRRTAGTKKRRVGCRRLRSFVGALFSAAGGGNAGL